MHCHMNNMPRQIRHQPVLNNLPGTQALVETQTALGRRSLLVPGGEVPRPGGYFGGEAQEFTFYCKPVLSLITHTAS